MIWDASSKQRSMRLARMWNMRSPGVATAWRGPALISRNGCSSAGRGWPNSLSHASDPIPSTQERFPSMSRKPTARNSPGRSPQNARTAARAVLPELMVTTRKIAARVKAPTTDWETGGAPVHRIRLDGKIRFPEQTDRPRHVIGGSHEQPTLARLRHGQLPGEHRILIGVARTPLHDQSRLIDAEAFEDRAGIIGLARIV